MNLLNRLAAVLSLIGVAAFLAPAQVNTLTQTTLSSAVLVTDKIINVTSATGINAPAVNTIGTELYVIAPGAMRGEVMLVQSTSSTAISVARGRQGAQTGFPSGSRVLIGQPNYFRDYDPAGGCTTALTFIAPHVNTKTGAQHVCSTVTLSWVPSWNTPGEPAGVTTAVASAAGSVVPSGPLFHITGTAAITGFTNASMIGFSFAGCFTAIPDGVFTWTAAGNIALAGTAVVNKALTFCWDQTNSKWIPSYIA